MKIEILQNNKGISLVQVIIVAGLLGGLSLVFMQLTSNINFTQTAITGQADEIELKSLIRTILNDSRYCRVSFAGNGPIGSPTNPVVFEKKNQDEPNEGLDVSLFYSNSAGDSRTLKKLNGANNPGSSDHSKFGKLSITSLKLIFNNPDASGNLNWNYPDSAQHNDMATLRVSTSLKTSSSQIKTQVIDYDVNLTLQTGQSPDNSEETRILACGSMSSTPLSGLGYPDSCQIALSHSDNGGLYRNAILRMDEGGFVGIRLRGDVNGDDRFKLKPECTSGNELSAYFNNCNLGFGWRDNTDNTSSINASPTAFKTYNANFGSTIILQTSGDVNADDSFYYRLRCPNGSNAQIDEYVKKKCRICMGHADEWFVSPQKSSCKLIQEMSDSSWARIMTDGDVGSDDSLFLGFFCEGEYSPTIKNWTY